jgi:phage anti-repressor protein
MELIPIKRILFTHKGEQYENFAVDGRTLHGKLGVKVDYNDWISSKLTRYQAKEGSDYIVTSDDPKEHDIDLNAACLFALLEHSEIGEKIDRYLRKYRSEYLEALCEKAEFAIRSDKEELEPLEIVKKESESMYDQETRPEVFMISAKALKEGLMVYKKVVYKDGSRIESYVTPKGQEILLTFFRKNFGH